MKLSQYAELAKQKNISKLIQAGFFSITFREDETISLQGNLDNIEITDLDFLLKNAEKKIADTTVFYRIIVSRVYFSLYKECKK